MRLTSGERVNYFEMGRVLGPNLGTLFQNPMDITPEDLNHEIDLAYKVRSFEMARHQKYLDLLGHLLCFPDLPRNF